MSQHGPTAPRNASLTTQQTGVHETAAVAIATAIVCMLDAMGDKKESHVNLSKVVVLAPEGRGLLGQAKGDSQT